MHRIAGVQVYFVRPYHVNPRHMGKKEKLLRIYIRFGQYVPSSSAKEVERKGKKLIIKITFTITCNMALGNLPDTTFAAIHGTLKWKLEPLLVKYIPGLGP